MSNASRKPGENAAARQGRKKMRVLGALAAITLLTWSRQLFGGEGDKTPVAESGKPAAGAKEKPGTPAAKGPRGAKSILNFEQAMERMTQWPEALHRRVIEGPIEDLSPINWMLDPEPQLADVGLVEEAATEPEPGISADPAPEAAWTQDHADGSSLGITLRSTVLFGSKRYAVLNGVRYLEGEEVSVGSGRYRLVSVRSREVILSSGDRTWTLVIRDQSVPELDPDRVD